MQQFEIKLFCIQFQNLSKFFEWSVLIHDLHVNKIKEKMGLNNLPKGLCEIAKLRLENPDMGLLELGKLLSPPLGKSGVNHRLKKLEEIANEL